MDKDIKTTCPLISVVICTYNRASFITKALESILKQSCDNYEVIIIDDASNDNTQSIVKAYIEKYQDRIRYYQNATNLGISKSRNKAVSLSRGEYIAMLDSDDYWIDYQKLDKQLSVLKNDPSIGLVGSAIECVDDKGNKIKTESYGLEDKDIRRYILIKNQFTQSSVLFPKKTFEEVGRYKEDMNVCEDFDFWLRIGNKYKLANIADITTAYTIHPGGISKIRKREIASEVDKIIDSYKKQYPNYWIAKSKSMLRIAKSMLD